MAANMGPDPRWMDVSAMVDVQLRTAEDYKLQVDAYPFGSSTRWHFYRDNPDIVRRANIDLDAVQESRWRWAIVGLP